MKPIDISEKLMFTTLRLEANDGSCGTGYYFNFYIGDYLIPTIITNKHVVKNHINFSLFDVRYCEYWSRIVLLWRWWWKIIFIKFKKKNRPKMKKVKKTIDKKIQFVYNTNWENVWR